MTTTPTGRNSATAFPPDVQHKLQMQGIFLGSPGDGLRSCLMFPGHGAQYPRMLDGLAERYPVVDDAFRRVDATYGELTGRSLTGLVFSDDAASELEDPEVMQPSIFAASIALHRLVVELGAEPEVLVGHSLGEISALVAAGSLSLEEGVVAVHGRGVAVKAIEPEDRGGMLSVQTDDDQARHRLERLLVIAGTGDLRVTRSLVNSPAQTVLSGHGGALDEFAARCREAGLETTRLPVSHGFHSELLAPAVPVLEKTLASLNWRLPQVPVLSTVFGDYYGEDDVARIPALLARQLVTPFSFQDMVTRIHDRGVRAFVEVGPKPILSGLVQRILDGRDAVSVPTNVHSVGAVESVRRFITFAQVHGLWQGQRAEVSESAQRVDVAEPANAGPTSEAVTVDADALLKVVARHTGYPAALLGVGKRMAGDLGFSSRVRADIVRALGEHLGVGVDACTVEGDITLGDLFDQVAALPTATAPVEDTVEEAAPAGAAPVAGRDVSEVSGVVLETAQAKTGYPLELLELDLELEADLGVDSVKQVEVLTAVRGHFGISADVEVDLSEVNTLRKVIDFIAVADLPAAGGASSEVVPVGRDVSEVSGVVLETAQAKTGYPLELLELDLELEADLGVDSVKQVEVLTAVRGHFGISADVEVDLSEVNTLRKVIDFIAVADLPESGGTPSAVSEEVPTRPAYTPVLERELETVTHRYLPVAVERPPAASAEPDFSLSGKGVVVIADRSGQVCRELLPRLTDAGARTRVISSAGAGIDGATEVDLSDPQRLEAALAAARDELEQVQVVINLYQLAGASEGESTLDAPVESWTREVDTRMAVELLTAKACYPGLAAAGSDGGYFAATAVGGCFGLESASALDPLGGLTSGFVKSLALELPEMKAKVVDFTEQEPQAVAHALFDEIVTTTEPNVEVAYTDGTRKIVLVMPQELEHNDLQEPLRLDSDDVVVVSGGSRGITYECAKELVAAYGATVVILGRTPMPGGDEEWLGLDDDELSSYRADYMRRAKKENPSLTPAEVNAEFGRLLNRRSLYQNLVALRAYNPQVSYEECDVADAGQVAEAMERIRLRHGRITGVLHGAGLQSLRTADKKDLEHSLDLVRIKVNGAYNLWRAVSADEPRFVALVGSILGRIGMDGQVDYTAAADVMPKMSAQMARILPGSRMFTIAWTAWVGTGMATDDSVRKVQEGQRGMSFVGIEEGVQTLVRELSYGGFDPETFISGDIGTNSWGGMDAALDEEKARIATPVGPTGHVADRLNHPLLDEVHHRGDSSVHAAKRLRGDVDLYLEDHAVRGAGTFPAVFHVEAHAEASGLAVPGGSLVAAEDVELLRFVKDNPKFPLTLSVRAEVSDDGGDRTQVSAEIRSDLVGPGGRVLEADRLHSRGRYWFAEQAPAAGEPAVSVPELLADGREMDLESFYERTSRHLLFGPTFRHVRSVRSTGDSSVVGEIVVPHNRGLFSFGTSPRFSAMPTVIDNAWRAPLMWIYEETGRFCVPVSIGTMRFHRSPLPTERVYAFSRVTRMETSAEVPIHVDTQIIDDAGRLLCDITDLVLTKVAEDAVEPRR